MPAQQLIVPQAPMLPYTGAEPAPTGPPALTAAPSTRALWCSFRRRWLLAVSAGLLGALVAVLAVMQLMPGRYTAQALVEVNPPQVVQDLGETAVDLRTFRENQQAVLKSSQVLNAALNRPDVRTLPVVQGQVDAVGWLRTQIKVDFNEGPSIMKVSMSGEDAQEVKTLVNAVATAYVLDAHQRERSKRQAELDAMNRTLQETQSGIQKKEHELAKKLLEWNLPDPRELDKEKDRLRDNVKFTGEALLKVELEATGLDAKLKTLQDQKRDLPGKAVPAYLIDEYLKDDEVVKKTKQTIAILAQEIPLLPTKYQKPLADEYAAGYEAQIKKLEVQLQDYRQKQEGKIRQKQLSKIEADIAETQSGLASVHDQKDRLKEAIDEFNNKLKKAETRQLPKEVAALDTAIKSDRASFDRMQDKVALVKARLQVLANDNPENLQASGANIALLQSAETPQTMDRSRQFKFAGAAGLGMFVLMLLGVTLVEFRSRKINGAEDVVQGLGLGLVGTVPALPDRVRKPSSPNPSPRDLYYQNLLNESIDSIRTMMLHAARGDALQVVMVTSAANGEGKTSLASHLAASLARAWKKTLLIDGDLRNPAAHKLFNQQLEPGFSDVLRGEVNATDAVHATPLGRLWLMPAGNWDSHALQALAQDGLREMFTQFKEQYDFIIVDSCPVLPVADSLLLAQHVDAVVFSILRDVSRAPSVHAAQQRLEGLGVRLLGAVMIGADTPAGSYPYAMGKAK
jgi:capsular exopolysaccharide synthesis family protein